MVPLSPQPEMRKVGFIESVGKKFEAIKNSLDKTSATSITSQTKIVESTNISDNRNDGLLRLRKFLEVASAITSRKQILESLDSSIHTLFHNNRVKFRVNEGKLTEKNRAFFSIKSKIGGAESKDAVKNILSQLETASKIPETNKNEPPTLTNILDNLLKNEWFNKTIEHDTSGQLKNKVLDIILNEVDGDSSVNLNTINELLYKLNSMNLINESVDSIQNGQLKQLEIKSILTHYELDRSHSVSIDKLDKLVTSEWFNGTIEQDTSGELKDKFLDILANKVVTDPNIKAKEVNSILAKLNSKTRIEEKINAFEEKLLDHSRKYGCDQSDFEKQYSKVEREYLGSDKEIKESFLDEYRILLKVIETEKSYKNTFGPQFVGSHEEAMKKLETYHYVVEKTEDKLFYHIDTLNLDGKREIRSYEVGDADIEKGPKNLKEKLDHFIANVNKERLNPK